MFSITYSRRPAQVFSLVFQFKIGSPEFCLDFWDDTRASDAAEFRTRYCGIGDAFYRLRREPDRIKVS